MGDERFGLSRSLDMFLLSRRQLSGFSNPVKGSLHSASVVELELLIFGKFATLTQRRRNTRVQCGAVNNGMERHSGP